MKSSQENVQDLETKLLLTTVKKPVSQRDAIVQFDYWVPMEGTCTKWLYDKLCIIALFVKFRQKCMVIIIYYDHYTIAFHEV